MPWRRPTATGAPAEAACDWLAARQVTTVRATGRRRARTCAPGGWAFQYENAHYPDVDDTAVVAMLLHRSGDPAYAEAIARARDWVLGMQSSNGGWGAFDVDNDYQFLNHIPFADHGALLDPPTVDVTARCVSFLAQIGQTPDDPAMARASPTSGRSRRRMAAGSAAGARTTSTAPGRRCAR